eukprot:CAMPEP_0201498202 /NCGR_PEP_ID=MMETSP0151_2-20130828/69928_1 /ASSEMBLY_ACC=CAM_ASM_000257 /TAXON_ID=200890 /ORGANISM="Paramoeba atlantica, Strain 621/1 / CCAP 1560/9" /LENGTH=422 /DNA_ID=CAMNT_0047889611 /DNA_START=60 /DNA_END=1328 /DNA_ORIENTATION=-
MDLNQAVPLIVESGAMIEVLKSARNHDVLRTLFSDERNKQVALSRSDNILLELDPAENTIGFLWILSFQTEKEIPKDRVSSFTHRVRLFVSKSNSSELNAEKFVLVMKTYGDITLEVNPGASIKTLYRAIEKLQKTEDHLTPIHALLLRACIKSMNYAAAQPLLKDRIYEIDRSIGNGAEMVLLFFYYAGCIFIGLKQFSRALEYLRMTFTVPAQSQSAITIEAYKKYILVSLLENGKTAPLPKYSGSFHRDLHSTCAAYEQLERGFGARESSEIQTIIQANMEVFTVDQNFGLVKQVNNAFRKKTVRRLTDTFITLSLADIGKSINMEDPQDVELLIMEMIDKKEVYGHIDQQTGIVHFGDDPHRFDNEELSCLLDQHMQRTMELGKRMRAATEDIMTSNSYLEATVKEKQYSELGGPSQY